MCILLKKIEIIFLSFMTLTHVSSIYSTEGYTPIDS